MRITVWKMDAKLTMEDVLINLKQLNYNQKISYLEGYETLNEHEKTLSIYWADPTPSKELHISSYMIGEDSFNYIRARGQYEYSISENTAVFEEGILPREARVFNRSVDTVFFEYLGAIYCALEINVSQESKVRSALFGQGRKNKMEEWGKLQFNEIDTFSLGSNYYYWLFSKRGKQLSITDNIPLKIIDVSAVSQLSPRAVYDHKSSGSNVLESLTALSGLGVNQHVYEGGFCFSLPYMDLYMDLKFDGSIIINTDKSTVNNDPEALPVVIDTTNLVQVVFNVYTLIIPKLKELHNKEYDRGLWNKSMASQQRKEWAFKVIEELCEERRLNSRIQR